MFEKKIHFLLIFFFFPFFFNCNKLKDLADPYVPISLNSFASLTSLTDQAQTLGYVPLYSSAGGEYGLISGADRGMCVVMRSGDVKCWGSRNADGQLGNGATSALTTPTLATALGTTSVSGGNFIVSMSSALDNSCAFFKSGFKCWGKNDVGQLASGSNLPSTSLTPIVSTVLNGKQIKQFTVGDFHACALFVDDSSVLCWGKNASGQLGDGTLNNSLLGVKPSIITETIRSVASSDFMTCVVTFSNKGYCWGNAVLFQNFLFSQTPTQVISGAASVSGGDASHICFIMLDQAVQCLGNNDKGQLGNGKTLATVGSASPVGVTNLTGASMIVAGESHTCAVAANNTRVYCWGSNSDGQLGNNVSGANEISAIPVLVQGLPASAEVVDIAASDLGNCALLSNEDVYCWGDTGLASSSKVATKILSRKDP